MSWCRFGSRCWATIPVLVANVSCKEDCPGSDLYVFEHVSGSFVCDMCLLDSKGRRFEAATEEAMLDHIEQHVAAGHHVRPSLRRGADCSPYVTTAGELIIPTLLRG